MKPFWRQPPRAFTRAAELARRCGGSRGPERHSLRCEREPIPGGWLQNERYKRPPAASPPGKGELLQLAGMACHSTFPASVFRAPSPPVDFPGQKRAPDPPRRRPRRAADASETPASCPGPSTCGKSRGTCASAAARFRDEPRSRHRGIEAEIWPSVGAPPGPDSSDRQEG